MNSGLDLTDHPNIAHIYVQRLVELFLIRAFPYTLYWNTHTPSKYLLNGIVTHSEMLESAVCENGRCHGSSEIVHSTSAEQL